MLVAVDEAPSKPRRNRAYCDPPVSAIVLMERERRQRAREKRRERDQELRARSRARALAIEISTAARLEAEAKVREEVEQRQAERDLDMLRDLYDHPAVLGLLQAVNASIRACSDDYEPWLAAAELIPRDLRLFAFGVPYELDPLYDVAVRLAWHMRHCGEDPHLSSIVAVYGISRERGRQVLATALRRLRAMPEVRRMHEDMQDDVPEYIPGFTVRREA